jgi:hypothetical protein
VIGLILLIDEYTHIARGNSYLPQEEPKLPSFQSAMARGAARLAGMGIWGVWAFRGLAHRAWRVPVRGGQIESIQLPVSRNCSSISLFAATSTSFPWFPAMVSAEPPWPLM